MKLKKSLGQNFLQDAVFLEKIYKSSGINSKSEVIEIGPGDGALTKLIVEQAKDTLAFEIDERFASKLTKDFEKKAFQVKCADFLSVNLKELKFLNPIIVGNLPYNVSSQIILKIIESNINFESCIFLIQKELANRFVPENKSTKISIQSKIFIEIEKLFDIPPGAFDPEPKVFSTLIKITPNKKYEEFYNSYPSFKKILSRCFQNPRKQIKHALKQMNLDEKVYSFDETSRAEDLEINHYFEILKYYENEI
tara:strand:+ start:4621 stop:5376 length:756 start_codon:yes stop_codon:yes gene_type:complete